MFQLDSAPSEYCRTRGGVVAGRETDAWLVIKGGATLFPDDFPFHIFIYGRFANCKVSLPEGRFVGTADLWGYQTAV